MRWGRTYAERNDALMEKRKGYIRFAWWPLQLFAGKWVWWEPVWTRWVLYERYTGGADGYWEHRAAEEYRA